MSQVKTLKLAVRYLTFAGPEVAVEGATVRLCSSIGGCDAKQERKTDSDGRASLDLGAYTDVYLEVEPAAGQEKAFPRTVYYPRALSGSKSQPLAIHVVPLDAVANYTRQLDAGDGILQEAGQSVIWPESCNRLAGLFAPDVTFLASKDDVMLKLERCAVKGGPPCVWYGDEKGVGHGLTATDVFGGGIIGLPAGPYKIGVCSRGVLVSVRDVEMKPAWLTMLRTWPLTKKEKERLMVGNPFTCPPPVTSDSGLPETPDSGPSGAFDAGTMDAGFP